MDRLFAVKQFFSDRCVKDRSVSTDRSRDGNRLLGVVGGFTDTPFAFAIQRVPGNHFARRSVKTVDAVRVPIQ